MLFESVILIWKLIKIDKIAKCVRIESEIEREREIELRIGNLERERERGRVRDRTARRLRCEVPYCQMHKAIFGLAKTIL